jgi:secreted Zn-dependent insulinase-like peptidase
LAREPYQRLGELGGRALYGSASIEESIATLMDVDFEQFLEFQAKFLRSLKLQWLIVGHLDEERAMNLFNIA